MADTTTPSPFTSTYSQFKQNVNNVVGPGVSPNPYNAITPAAQALSVTQPTPEGAAAVQSKSQGKYSNKQFVAPFSYTQNIEGVFIQVDYLGKKVKTSSSQPYRSIASLAATALPVTLINNPAISNPDRLVKSPTTTTPTTTTPKTTPTENAATQQFGVGINALTSSLAGRTTQYISLIQTPTSQLFSNLTNSGTAALAGELQNKLPFTNINQQIAHLPGFSIVTNALGNIPGGGAITNALSNPVGAAAGLLQQTVASSINIQGGLPSVSLGSLGDALNIATNLASSGPPTSLTGIIALEKQIKGIVCNFTLPIIPNIDFNAIINFKFPNPEDIVKNLKKQLEDIKSKIVNQLDISKQLKNLEEQIVKEIQETIDKIVKELTTCDNSPTSKQNAKSGQKSS